MLGRGLDTDNAVSWRLDRGMLADGRRIMSADSSTLRQHATLMSDVPGELCEKIIRDVFDQPVIGNLYRPHYVERIIALALGNGFELVSADWSGWDIESDDGARIEVKQCHWAAGPPSVFMTSRRKRVIGATAAADGPPSEDATPTFTFRLASGHRT
jgi:hypothetical protein